MKIRLSIKQRIKFLFTGEIDFNEVPIKEADLDKAVKKALQIELTVRGKDIVDILNKPAFRFD